ncbi:helix-turn-helix transcriptional regulator [Paenibacillus sp. OAS669]|uniref:helix-turn-helix transcriptional regulator n=1 Tax=Paenibacillus sp. OAS669 TaxID=2663821 RepID=UPI00178B4023|nr:WYL domain-containing protein [Paenibacillus sp. OAS669]MBE1446980.1 putative DNA-binding transcriptional regulator YafY [Paenibacillus sp. OAS669]
MSKADNMLAILWLLKDRKRVTAKQLADELEIHVRTVYRYIDALCASGVPIIADSGHNGGYSLLSQFNEAPLFFDMTEQKALIHAAVFAQEAGYPYGEALQRAVGKLKMYTNEEQLNEINRHLVGFDVIHAPADDSHEALLQELEVSVARGCTVEMSYLKGTAQLPLQRRIDPYGLVYWKGKWYIVGFCHLRRDVRSFRVDRIQEVSPTSDRFERPQAFSAKDFFLGTLLPDKDNEEKRISIRIAGRESAINDLCAHWYLGHVLEERSATEAHFRLEERAVATYFPHLLLSYGRSIQVKEPAILRDKLVELASQLADYYRSM